MYTSIRRLYFLHRRLPRVYILLLWYVYVLLFIMWIILLFVMLIIILSFFNVEANILTRLSSQSVVWRTTIKIGSFILLSEILQLYYFFTLFIFSPWISINNFYNTHCSSQFFFAVQRDSKIGRRWFSFLQTKSGTS